MAEEQVNERREKLKSKLAFGALSFTAIILFLGVIGTAVWRAYVRDAPPPTPTIPAGVEPTFGYVSAVEGLAESQLPGIEIAVPLGEGDTVAAGPGALVRTGLPGWLRMGFVNGASLFLDSESEIELEQIGQVEGEVNETVVQLNYGRMVVETGSSEQLSLVIEAPIGAQSSVEEGVMGIVYNRSSQRFEVHCLSGSCTLRSQAGQIRELAEGEASSVQGFSAPFDVRPAAYELFQDLGDPGMIPTATPTQEDTTPTPSPTREESSPTPVTIEATEPLPTFTPRPSPSPRVFPTATIESGSPATASPSATGETALPVTVTGTPEGTPTSTSDGTAEATAGVTVTNTPPPTLTGTPGDESEDSTTATPGAALTVASATATPSPADSIEADEELPVATVFNADWLNVREGPGNWWDTVTSLPRGSELELTGYRDEDATWVSVRTPVGIEGWAHTFFLESDYSFEQLEIWPGATATPTPIEGDDG